MTDYSKLNNMLNEAFKEKSIQEKDYCLVICNLLEFENQLEVFHWQTESHAQHMAFGEIYDEVHGIKDTLVELLISLYGRFTISPSHKMKLRNIQDVDLNQYLDEVEEFFTIEIKTIIEPTERNDDIYNLMEEFTALIKKLRYLLTQS